MSGNLRKTIKDLAFVSNIKCKKTQKCILNYIAREKKYREAIKELAINIINGNITIDNKTKSHIKKYKNLIYKNRKPTRKLINQSGGWLHWIIPIVASLIEIVL